MSNYHEITNECRDIFENEEFYELLQAALVRFAETDAADAADTRKPTTRIGTTCEARRIRAHAWTGTPDAKFVAVLALVGESYDDAIASPHKAFFSTVAAMQRAVASYLDPLRGKFNAGWNDHLVYLNLHKERKTIVFIPLTEEALEIITRVNGSDLERRLTVQEQAEKLGRAGRFSAGLNAYWVLGNEPECGKTAEDPETLLAAFLAENPLSEYCLSASHMDQWYMNHCDMLV